MNTKHLYLILMLSFVGAALGGYVGTSQLMNPEPSDTGELLFTSLTLDDNRIVRGANTTLHIGLENTSPTPKTYTLSFNNNFDYFNPVTKNPLESVSGMLDTTATISIIVRAGTTIQGSEEEILLRVELYEMVDAEEVLIDTYDKSITVTYA
jgi:hypothetical protein